MIEIKDPLLISLIYGMCDTSPIINDGSPEGKQIKLQANWANKILNRDGFALLTIEHQYQDKLAKALELLHKTFSHKNVNEQMITNTEVMDFMSFYWSTLEPKVQEVFNAIEKIKNYRNGANTN